MAQEANERGNKGARALRAGIRELRDHRPDKAVRSLRLAVEDCPACEARELAQRLYWLAVALLRLDQSEVALKSLASAQKLRPRGIARKAYLERINCYGMPRRRSADLDDLYAFFSIKMREYLGSRGTPRFGSDLEKDLVTDLISAAWLELRQSARLRGLMPAARIALMRRWPVDFPAGMAFGPGGQGAEPCVVNFRTGRTVGPDDRCPCGSGLPYRLCCGRTQGLGELPR